MTPLSVCEVHFTQTEHGMDTEVTSSFNGKTVTTHASGNGRLDAVSNALKQAYDLQFELVTYQEHALEKSSSSRAIAYVGIQKPDKTLAWGAGIHADIIHASIAVSYTHLGLDVVAREQFYQLLLEEFTETGRTFVISTHIIEEAADIFEEVIFLHHGKIILKENTQKLLEETVYVSGRAETVDAVIQGKEIYRPKTLGRSKSVLVRLQEGEILHQKEGITIQPVNCLLYTSEQVIKWQVQKRYKAV